MKNLLSRARGFLAGEDGPTSVEYASMLALIVVACITIVSVLGKGTSPAFSTVNSTLAVAKK